MNPSLSWPLPAQSRGAALITALLVVVLATTAVVSLLPLQQAEIRRTQWVFRTTQARQYALGIEDWAVGTLFRDSQKNQYDGLNDLWAQPLPPTKIEGGEISGRVVDLQGRFNLNNLIEDGKPRETAQVQLERLLRLLEIKPDLATDMLVWMLEAHVRKESDGGLHFLPLAHPSELLQVPTMTPEIYAKLAPQLTALPGATPINVNTATPEVLASLREDGTLDQARNWALTFAEKPLEQIDQIAAMGLASTELTVMSHFFQVEGQVVQGEATYRISTHLQRSDHGEISVILRTGE